MPSVITSQPLIINGHHRSLFDETTMTISIGGHWSIRDFGRSIRESQGQSVTSVGQSVNRVANPLFDWSVVNTISDGTDHTDHSFDNRFGRREYREPREFVPQFSI